MCEVWSGRGEAGRVNKLTADTTLHQPLRPVFILTDVTGPLTVHVTRATDLARRLA